MSAPDRTLRTRLEWHGDAAASPERGHRWHFYEAPGVRDAAPDAEPFLLPSLTLDGLQYEALGHPAAIEITVAPVTK